MYDFVSCFGVYTRRSLFFTTGFVLLYHYQTVIYRMEIQLGLPMTTLIDTGGNRGTDNLVKLKMQVRTYVHI